MYVPFFWISDKGDWPRGLGPISMTIGNFDGVHLGHQKLLECSLAWAKAHQGSAIVLTFFPHPSQVLLPEKKHTRLFDLDDQKMQFLKIGMNGVFLQPFSREFSEMSAEGFLNKFIFQNFHPSHIVVGYDFSFGRERKGNALILENFCRQNKIEFNQIPAFQVQDKVVSTSSIRNFLEAGEPHKAFQFLGRCYYLKGIVKKGDQRGRLLGFATANIKPQVDFFPKMGVYATRSWLQGKSYNSVTNIGLNLTFVEGDLNPIKVETHILNFNQDVYGTEMRVELLQYLRAEKRFSGIAELKSQIALDIKMAEEFF